MSNQSQFEEATRAIVAVGHGRGFVVQCGNARMIVTAAHCLPRFPPRASISLPHQRTYAKLLGKIGTKHRSILAECLYLDPIRDIEVLGEPEVESENYRIFTEEAGALPLEDIPREKAWVLALEGH